ncbi:MAG: ribose-phosphate pyrophosphokinase, partial [Candidatus Aenigmatarchaeota archaeon]
MAKLIERAGADEVYTFDLHGCGLESDPDVFPIPAYNLTATSLLAEYLDKEHELIDPIVISPDEGAKEWAK